MQWKIFNYPIVRSKTSLRDMKSYASLLFGVKASTVSKLTTLFLFPANFQLPEKGHNFDDVEYVELDEEEARKLVETYNKEGQEAYPPDQQWGRDRWVARDNRWGGGNKAILTCP